MSSDSTFVLGCHADGLHDPHGRMTGIEDLGDHLSVHLLERYKEAPLVTKGIATRSKDATRNKGIATNNKGITTKSK